MTMWKKFYNSRIGQYIFWTTLVCIIWKAQSFEIAVIYGLGVIIGETIYEDLKSNQPKS